MTVVDSSELVANFFASLHSACKNHASEISVSFPVETRSVNCDDYRPVKQKLEVIIVCRVA